MRELYVFLSGMIAMACWVAGLFFFRFARRTRDRLFSLFALAFWILGVERALPVLLSLGSESLTVMYVIRLTAFVVILFAIIDKNSASKKNSISSKDTRR